MHFRQLLPISAALLSGCQACLHDHILAPRLENEQAALRRGDVPAPVKMAIQNVRVFDGYAVGKPQTVIIEDGYITSSDENVAHIIDAGNRIMIPGLIDSHTHVQSVEGLENMTSYGVTTVFDMACQDYALCNSLKSMPGLASLFVSMLNALAASDHKSKLGQPSPELLVYPGKDPRFLVDYAFGNGSDYFKIVSQVFGPPQDQQSELVEYAHSKGQFVVAHAADVASYTRSVKAGTDVMQHIPDDGLLPPSVIKSMKENSHFSTPTMEIFRRAYTIQPEILQFLRGNSSATNTTYEHVIANVRRQHLAGVPILAGTDAVGNLVPGIYFPFGETLHHELVNLVSAGLTPAEALRAATIVPATAHRLHDRGAILPGMRADLILLNSDPLLNISNTRDIARIWVGGVEYANVAKLT
ncbi:hypothetical protein GGR52DRAFT_494812 [Hypoxylon sp. FL1284]|nr:hypothetical protein GGR52DRAFT_494812 [Hypoxylon sp. FL1284]